MNKSIHYVLAWSVLLMVLFLPQVNNHTETEDAYMYAQQLVEVDSWAHLIHTNHKIYHVICNEAFNLLNKFYEIDALSTLILISKVSAFLSLILLNQCFLLLGLNRWKALVILALLSVTYNFWRYTHAAEINAMAWLSQSIFIYLLLKSRTASGKVWPIAIGAFVVFSALIHTINVIPLTIIGGTFYFFSKQYVKGLLFASSLTLLIFSSFAFIEQQHIHTKPKADALLTNNNASTSKQLTYKKESAKKLSLKSLPKATVGLGASIIGSNIVMGYDSLYFYFRDSLFKDRYLFEERHAAKGLPNWYKTLWLILLLTFLGALVIIFWNMLTLPSTKGILASLSSNSINSSLWCGCITSLLFVLWFEPGNPEMWTLVLPIIIIPFLLLLTKIPIKKLEILYILFAFLNYIGGIHLLRDYSRDYFYTTVTPLLKVANDGDLLLKSSIHSGIPRYAYYNYPNVNIGTLNINGDLNEKYEIIKNYLEGGKRVFVHEEILNRSEKFGTDLAEHNLKFVPNPQTGGQILKTD